MKLIKFSPDCLIISTNSDWMPDYEADRDRLPPIIILYYFALYFKNVFWN